MNDLSPKSSDSDVWWMRGENSTSDAANVFGRRSVSLGRCVEQLFQLVRGGYTDSSQPSCSSTVRRDGVLPLHIPHIPTVNTSVSLDNFWPEVSPKEVRGKMLRVTHLKMVIRIMDINFLLLSTVSSHGSVRSMAL